MTSWPMAFCWTSSQNWRATSRWTSASSRAVAHLAHGLGHVLLADLAPPAEITEDVAEPVGKCFEHVPYQCQNQRILVGLDAAC